MLCDFVDGRCARCGVERQPPYPKRNCSPGLGDRARLALEAVGITKARAQAVATAFGLGDCGCDERREALNQWGRGHLGIGLPTPSGPLDQ